jgi:hypothetical protein
MPVRTLLQLALSLLLAARTLVAHTPARRVIVYVEQYYEMRCHHLSLTAEDIELIHMGLASRSARPHASWPAAHGRSRQNPDRQAKPPVPPRRISSIQSWSDRPLAYRNFCHRLPAATTIRAVLTE